MSLAGPAKWGVLGVARVLTSGEASVVRSTGLVSTALGKVRRKNCRTASEASMGLSRGLNRDTVPTSTASQSERGLGLKDKAAHHPVMLIVEASDSSWTECPRSVHCRASVEYSKPKSYE